MIGVPLSARICAADVDPRQPGQHQVEQDDVGTALAERLQRPRTVGDERGIEAVGAQDDAEHLREGRVVVDHEYARFHLHMVTPRRDQVVDIGHSRRFGCAEPAGWADADRRGGRAMTGTTAPSTAPGAAPGTPIATRTLPLRPLGVGELLDSAVRLVRHNARTAFSLSFPFAVVRAALVALLAYNSVGSPNFAIVQLLLQLAVAALFGTALTGLLAPAFTGEFRGRRYTAGECLRAVGRSGWALAGLCLLVAGAQEVGVVLAYVGGAWLWGIWAVAAPASVVERLGPRRALGRSFELVRTEFWHTWGIRTLRVVLTYTLGLFITLPFTALAAFLSSSALLSNSGPSIHNPGVYVAVVAIGTLISTTVMTPIGSAVDALLYLDLRMRREGMDLVMALPPAPVAPAPQQAW